MAYNASEAVANSERLHSGVYCVNVYIRAYL